MRTRVASCTLGALGMALALAACSTEQERAVQEVPQELELPIDATVSPEDADGHIYAPGTGQCNTIEPTHAKLGIFGVETVLPVATGDSGVTFQVTLEQTGITQLDAWFIDASGDTCGAYYVGVERL